MPMVPGGAGATGVRVRGMDFTARRVVTGHDADGRAVIVSDAPPDRTIRANGFAVATWLWLDGPPATVDDGGDEADGPMRLQPPPGGCSARVIRVPRASEGAGRSYVLPAGAPPAALDAGETRLVELGQTGGALSAPDQGGDPGGGWELDPRGGGVAFRWVRLPAGNDPGEAGWHTTATIDV